MLAVITVRGRIYLAYETVNRILLRTSDGESMDKGPVHRFMPHHLVELKNSAVPSMLVSALAMLRCPRTTEKSKSTLPKGPPVHCTPPL